MKTRVAIIAIIVESEADTEQLNRLISQCAPYVIGRMGIPYRQKGINIISVAIDAPQDLISSLSGQLGALPGITTKIAYSNVITEMK